MSLQIKDDEEVQYVKLEKLEKLLFQIMVNKEYEPDGEDVLLLAFQVASSHFFEFGCIPSFM